MLLLFWCFCENIQQVYKEEENLPIWIKIGCACSMGAKRYWLIILLALAASLFSQLLAAKFVLLNTTTSMVVFSTLLGVLASFTKLRFINGSSEVATTMLYILIALIGSQSRHRKLQWSWKLCSCRVCHSRDSRNFDAHRRKNIQT